MIWHVWGATVVDTFLAALIWSVMLRDIRDKRHAWAERRAERRATRMPVEVSEVVSNCEPHELAHSGPIPQSEVDAFIKRWRDNRLYVAELSKPSNGEPRKLPRKWAHRAYLQAIAEEAVAQESRALDNAWQHWKAERPTW